MNDNPPDPLLAFAEAWELVHGRKPTPEELEHSRGRALMILDSIALSTGAADSEYIWKELDKKEDHA